MARLEQTGLNGPPGSWPRHPGPAQPPGAQHPAAGQGCTTGITVPGCCRPPRTARCRAGRHCPGCCRDLWCQAVGTGRAAHFSRAKGSHSPYQSLSTWAGCLGIGMFVKRGRTCHPRPGWHSDARSSRVPSPPHRWPCGCRPGPPLPGLLPKGGREPCASPRDCDKHYTGAVNV